MGIDCWEKRMHFLEIFPRKYQISKENKPIKKI